MASLFGDLARSFKNLSATTPVSFSRGRLSFSQPWQSDRSTQLGTSSQVGTIFSIVNQVSTSVSQVEWKLYRKSPSGKEEDRQQVLSHVALDLLQNPNPFQGWQEFCECFSQHVELTGEGYWLIGRDRNGRSKMPLTMWTVRPDRMNPIPDPETFLRGWMYKGPDGEDVPLGLDDVVQVRMPHPTDPYRGLGPIQGVLATIDSLKLAAQWNRNFFFNSAEPGGIIEVDKRLSDDEFNEMTMRWREQHQGVAQAHRVAVIEQGKWVDRKYSHKDMQFSDLTEISREVIREAWAIHKHILGGADDVNRANADAAELTFGRRILKSRLMRIKGNLNGPYLRLFGADQPRMLEFDCDWDDVVPEDEEAETRELTAKANAFKIFIDAGADWNDSLDKLDLPSIKKGEAPKPPALPPAPVPAPGQPGADGQSVARLPRRVWNAGEVTPGRRDWEDALAGLLELWAGIVSGQRDELDAQIATAVDRGDLGALAALVVTSASGADELAQAMDELAVQAARRVVAEGQAQGVSFGPVAPAESDMKAIAEVVAALMAAGLANAAGREALRVRGPDSTGREVADEVGRHLDSLSDAYLKDNLGGALWAAESAGRFATLENAPRATFYTANEMNDGRACTNCANVDGQVFNTLEDARAEYPYAGYRLCLGGIRCRGEITPHWGVAQ